MNNVENDKPKEMTCPPIPVGQSSAILPVLPMTDTVLYPGIMLPFLITDEEALAMIDEVLSHDRIMACIVIKEENAESAEEAHSRLGRDSIVTPLYDLYEYGTSAEIMKMSKLPDGTTRLVVRGLERIKLEGILQRKPYARAKIKIEPDIVEATPELEALVHTVMTTFINVIKQIPYLPEELSMAVLNINSPTLLAYLIASNMNLSVPEKQKILELPNVKDKLERLLRLISRELEVLKMSNRIQAEIQGEITKAQKEEILREQMRIIQKELGETDERTVEIEEIKAKLKDARLSPEAQKVADEELNRLIRIPSASAEYSVVRTYLDWLIELPWSAATEDKLDINEAQKVLDEDHYGLEKVKERILEYLAVRKLKQDLPAPSRTDGVGNGQAGMRGPILCFVGPPGVGKTSLGKSIARALGRKFYRMSLGGIRDEAEIRGHRRTYVGALPGRILQGIRKAASNNPVFMLDEVDKIGMDFRGDPSSALLEVLDPEQNFSFSDHYLEVPFDLSRVMFITTANILDTIPPALQDRMEVLELPGYTEEEKIKIAQRHLVSKQLKEHGLEAQEFEIDESALGEIINAYTREAGVRNLERNIATICRKIAKDKVSGKEITKKVTAQNLEKFLGQVQFFQEVAERTSEPGVATGLAWTPSGGDILFVESTRMRGNKNLTLTGHLGEVMKESAQAALSYIRSHAKKLKLAEDFFKDSDIHIHVPAGAIPKDGPSAGLTMAVSLISLLTDKPVRPDVAMTGEITLRGKVLPVGGIKEKVLAARRAGIKTVILPKKNTKDIKEIPERLTRGLNFAYVETIDQATKQALKS